ncbi:hypothetical protein SNE25_10045 [Mucilaginibacter sabulilitoris]|uniref:Uncharacterized protein n=1 Tax=Mucilaginibacter sabulilitoris TaxID=1173583 RepID=A0ABZ0TUN0_9SPHI|nr:hypothetical protein [Mucilaginibacter sabulilitoris]WPU95858.1 hypothetical protein SNE25_10045 [Mucilaginibacter sabulilitoris]
MKAVFDKDASYKKAGSDKLFADTISYFDDKISGKDIILSPAGEVLEKDNMVRLTGTTWK